MLRRHGRGVCPGDGDAEVESLEGAADNTVINGDGTVLAAPPGLSSEKAINNDSVNILGREPVLWGVAIPHH